MLGPTLMVRRGAALDDSLDATTEVSTASGGFAPFDAGISADSSAQRCSLDEDASTRLSVRAARLIRIIEDPVLEVPPVPAVPPVAVFDGPPSELELPPLSDGADASEFPVQPMPTTPRETATNVEYDSHLRAAIVRQYQNTRAKRCPLGYDCYSMESRRPSTRWRLAALVVVLVGLFAIGRATGLASGLSAEQIRTTVHGAGPWGYVAYTGAFVGGELLHVPGMIFVGAGVLAFGKVTGFIAAFVTSILSVCVSFVFVRAVGGRALESVQRPFVQRALAHLDAHPVRTVVVLRLALWLAPPVNYGLALSTIKFRDYLVGSALGLVVPVSLAVLLFDTLFARFGWLFR